MTVRREHHLEDLCCSSFKVIGPAAEVQHLRLSLISVYLDEDVGIGASGEHVPRHHRHLVVDHWRETVNLRHASPEQQPYAQLINMNMNHYNKIKITEIRNKLIKTINIECIKCYICIINNVK